MNLDCMDEHAMDHHGQEIVLLCTRVISHTGRHFDRVRGISWGDGGPLPLEYTPSPLLARKRWWQVFTRT